LFGPEVILFDPWNAIARDERARDYLGAFQIIREVFPSGDAGPAIGIVAHTRKPTVGERANGRALLNLLSGSYTLGAIPRCVWVMQNASDETDETRVVWTCCKNNDGELGKPTAWVRQNGLFTQVHNFDWDNWNEGNKEGAVPIEEVAGILEENPNGLRRAKLAKEIELRGVGYATSYRRITQAVKAGLIKLQKGSDDVYVLAN
jgi:hypothetical protein